MEVNMKPPESSGFAPTLRLLMALALLMAGALVTTLAGPNCGSSCLHEHHHPVGDLEALPLHTPEAIPGVIVSCCPASPEPFTVEQPDGLPITLHIRGNEFFHWFEDTQGYVVMEGADRTWRYALPKPGRAEFEIIPNAKVGRVNPEALGLSKHNLPSKNAIRQRVNEAMRSIRDSMGSPPADLPPNLAQLIQARSSGASPTPSTPPDSSSPSLSPAGEDPGEPSSPDGQDPNPISIAGTITVKNIVILAAFNDHWDEVAGTVSASFGRPRNEYDALFNQIGHTTDGAAGSVKDYYLENSYGLVNIDSLVSVWVRLPQNESYYGANGASKDTNWRVMILDAIEALDAAGFDFSVGDGDGDGWVDCLTVIHSGYGEEAGGAGSADRIWSKQGLLSSVVTKDGVKLFRVHTEPALRDYSGTDIIRIGVICHELGHFFGLPDLYDYAGVHSPVGKWCVMASGGWNGIDGARPSHFCAWSKVMLGFVKPTLVSSGQGLTLREVENYPDVHMVRDGLPENEYFLLENRNGIGFDALTPGLTPGKGILIWHVDTKQVNNDSANNTHPVVKLEEADGNNIVGQTTDPWFSGNPSMLAGGFRDQTGNLNTSAMSYQSSHYFQRSNNAANYSHIRVSGFSAPGATMTYNLTTLVPTVLTNSAGSANYTVSWAPTTDAVRYEIQEGVPTTTSSFTEGFEDADLFHENWIVSGAQRSTGGAQQGSTSLVLSANFGGKRWNICQFIETRKSFSLQANTSISFYYLCKLSSGNGSLKLQATSDDGKTWRTLWTHGGGYVNTWSLVNISTLQITGAGFTIGQSLKFRFVLVSHFINGWTGFPSYGWAIDTFTINNTTVPAYNSWNTLSANVATTSYPITGKSNGSYSYRVRASRDGSTFSKWSQPQKVEVFVQGGYSSWAGGVNWAGQDPTHAADPDGDGIRNFLEYAFGSNPLVADAVHLPSLHIESEGGTRFLVLVYRKNKSAPELTYTVESSTNLVAWQTENLTETTLSEDALIRTVSVRKELSGQREFLRLRVRD
jgi:M6 family metalloprotease-like protein